MIVISAAVLLFLLIVIFSCGKASAATIIIEVRDDETRLPIKGAYASVRIFNENKGEWSIVLAESTNANGLLVLRDLEGWSKYFILITADKYFDWVYKDKFSFEPPDILVIKDDGEIVKLKILLSPLQSTKRHNNLSAQRKGVLRKEAPR